jgi:hypothetical protein
LAYAPLPGLDETHNLACQRPRTEALHANRELQEGNIDLASGCHAEPHRWSGCQRADDPPIQARNITPQEPLIS